MPDAAGRPARASVSDPWAGGTHASEHGTREERKRVIRAFAEGITLDAASGGAELTMKELPEPGLLGVGSCLNKRTARTSWPGRFCGRSGGPLRSPKGEEGEGGGEGEVSGPGGNAGSEEVAAVRGAKAALKVCFLISGRSGATAPRH
jgi:hypothetical protein